MGQGPEALDKDFKGNQVAVHGQEQQGNGDGINLGKYGHVHTVGRIDHRGKAQPHLHGDHLAGNHEQLPECGQRKAHADADEYLLQGNDHGIGASGLPPEERAVSWAR